MDLFPTYHHHRFSMLIPHLALSQTISDTYVFILIKWWHGTCYIHNSALQSDDFFLPSGTSNHIQNPTVLEILFFCFGCCCVVILMLDSLSPLGLESHKKMSSLSNSTRTASDGLLYCCPCIKMSSLPSTFFGGEEDAVSCSGVEKGHNSSRGILGIYIPSIYNATCSASILHY